MTSAMEAKPAISGALRGARVVDFGHYISGPLLGMLLCDQGAEVIKVERPGGDPARRQPAFATWNRGKRSIVLDLKTAEGQQHAQELARAADVVIENFRPGVAQRLGIGYDQLSKLNTRLIYCSLPGFGAGSPYRNLAGWEPIVGAATGWHQKAGNSDEPVFDPLPIASNFAAIDAAVSVGMALIARNRTGLGQRIEVPLHSAMFTAMGRHLVKLRDLDYQDRRHYPQLPMVRQYQCADGRWVQHNGTFERFVRQFLTVAGHPEWIEEAVADQKRILDEETGAMWLERFQNIFRQRTAQEWEDQISAAGGACSVCKTIDEWLEHPHPTEAGMVVEVEDAKLGRMKQPGVQVKLRGSPGAIQGRAPLLGEHTKEILAELNNGAQPAPSFAPPPRGPEDIMQALEGVKVLDLCIILAGPTCGRTLAEFGADVTKIDDPSRPTDLVGNIDVNRGKRSILLDLKTQEGIKVFWRLLEKADVIVENYRKGKLAKLGLGYEDVRQRKPDIIYASLNAYGYDGPWSERAGWEQLAQAASGIQARRGGRDGAPTLLPYPVNDYGTGMLGAYAVALALYERQRTGHGQQVDSGLALTAGFHQSPYFLDYEGFERQEPEGLGLRGFSALSRLYQASDGWLCLHCPEDRDWEQLVTLPDFMPLSADSRFATPEQRASHDTELSEAMSRIFATRERSYWIERLNAAGVSAMENIGIADFRDDPYVRQAGLIVTRELPGRGRVDHLGNPAQLSGTPMRLGRPSPLHGADTREILLEAGYSEAEIETLIARQVVTQTTA